CKSEVSVDLRIHPAPAMLNLLPDERNLPGAYPEEGVCCVRDYELGIVLSPEASEEQTKGILDRVEQVVQTYGGQVVKIHPWGRRRLAYPIERHRDGLYFFLDLSLTPQTLLEIDRNLKVAEEVIRHLIVKRDPRAIAVQRAREAQAAAAAEASEELAPEPEALAEASEAGEAQPEAAAEAAVVTGEVDYAPEAAEEVEGEA
ncbi:MAG TPA: 30S ribosomal protein S6, partial [Ktedonobacterales bacterium]|nr:30S ribosomal protein S6 [Ktedonobacterales bacterium]